MGPGLTRNLFLFGKSSKNSPTSVLIFWSGIPLLKVVGYYDLSVLSMTVMGFKKKVWGVGGWGELLAFCVWIFGTFFTLQSPLHIVVFRNDRNIRRMW